MRKKSIFSPARRRCVNWPASVYRLRVWCLAGGLSVALVALAPPTRAQDNYTYTGTTGTAAAPTTSTTFTAAFTDTTSSTAFTTPGGPAGTLTFGGGATTYAATDDIANLTLAGLSFTNTTGSTVTINAANGATVNGTGATLNFATSTGAVVFNPAINEGAATLTFSGGAAATLGGIIGGTSGLNKGGTGTVTLNNTNTYTGGTTVNGGVLALNAGGGTGTVQGAITVNAGATLNLAANDSIGYNLGNAVTTINVNGGTVTSVAGTNQGFYTSYSLTGGTVSAGALFRFNANSATPAGITSLASATTSQFNANIDDFVNGATVAGSTNTLTINVAKGTTASGVDLQIGGAIQSAGALNKTGAGSLNLTAQNTFTGNVIVSNGTLNVGTAAANDGSSGALGLSNGGKTITVNAGATLSGTTTNWFGNQVNVGTLPTITVNGGNLSAARYTALGALNLNGATVTTNDAVDTGNYQTIALRGDVTVGGTAASTITATAPSATSGGIHLGANTAFTVGSTGAAGADLAVNAPLRNQSGDFGNAAGGLTKAGVGTMLLTATNTYTGPTVVNAGSLYVSGSTATGSAVTVSNAGTVLGGAGNGANTGIIGGPITVGSGATLSAGNRALATPAVGILTTGVLTLGTGSTFNALVAGDASFSTLNATGTTALGNAAFSISLVPGATFTNGTVLELITSNVSGQFTNSVYNAGGYRFTADYSTNPGFFSVGVSAVPEPSTWLCVGGGLVGVAGAALRRRIAGRRASSNI